MVIARLLLDQRLPPAFSSSSLSTMTCVKILPIKIQSSTVFEGRWEYRLQGLQDLISWSGEFAFALRSSSFLVIPLVLSMCTVHCNFYINFTIRIVHYLLVITHPCSTYNHEIEVYFFIIGSHLLVIYRYVLTPNALFAISVNNVRIRILRSEQVSQ